MNPDMRAINACSEAIAMISFLRCCLLSGEKLTTHDQRKIELTLNKLITIRDTL